MILVESRAEVAAVRKTLLIILIWMVQGVLAQERPPTPKQPEETGAMQGQSQAQPAPKLGHPLDPADVDVLTGKTKTSGARGDRPEAAPYPSMSYPVNAAGYLPSRSLRSSSLFSLPFAPRVFGRAHGRSSLLLGDTTGFAPPLFLFTRGHIGSGNFASFPPAHLGFFFFFGP